MYSHNLRLLMVLLVLTCRTALSHADDCLRDGFWCREGVCPINGCCSGQDYIQMPSGWLICGDPNDKERPNNPLEKSKQEQMKGNEEHDEASPSTSLTPSPAPSRVNHDSSSDLDSSFSSSNPVALESDVVVRSSETSTSSGTFNHSSQASSSKSSNESKKGEIATSKEDTSTKFSSKMNPIVIAGIVVGAVACYGAIILVVLRRRRKKSDDKTGTASPSDTPAFTFKSVSGEDFSYGDMFSVSLDSNPSPFDFRMSSESFSTPQATDSRTRSGIVASFISDGECGLGTSAGSDDLEVDL